MVITEDKDGVDGKPEAIAALGYKVTLEHAA